MKELFKRLSSAIIGIIILLLIVSKGKLYLSLSIYIVSLVGLWEFYKAIKNINLKPIEYIGFFGATLLFISKVYPQLSLGFVITIITLYLLCLIIFNKEITLESISITILSICYIPFFLFHVSYLDGTKYIWLIFIIAFGSDTFAYIAGNLFGKNKLCPKISPKKTVEGSIGGILGSMILTTIFSLYFNLGPLWKILILSVLASITSQIGDLVASRVKRLAGVKDYGFIMPGHGGVLDRFDSILFTAPLIYYYIVYFIH